MRKENYKDEVNFTEEQIKIDRRRDPAIDYSYDDKGSIFRKMSKSRAEKKMHKEGHIGYSDRLDSNYDLGDYYDSSDYYDESDYDNLDSSYTSNDYNSTANKENNDIFNKAKSWVEQNTSKESKDLFNTLKNEYKNIQSNAEANKNKGFSKQYNKSNKKSKSGGYKTCKNCGSQMYSDAKVCPKCGEDQKKSNTGGFVMRTIFKFIGIILIINLIIGVTFFIFNRDDNITYDEEIANEEISTEEPYIAYEEYSKPVRLKYIANPKDVIKTDKEKFEVGAGKELEAGEYIFIKNEGNGLGSVKVFTQEDKSNPELFETVVRNYYVKLDDGDTVELKDGTLYRADQVELDMDDENNMKSGMYRLGKDVGDNFSIEGNSKTYFAIIDKDNIIITNGFLEDGMLSVDKAFIEDSAMQGEVAKYVYINNGILIRE